MVGGRGGGNRKWHLSPFSLSAVKHEGRGGDRQEGRHQRTNEEIGVESNTDEESNNRHDVEEADETIVLHGHQNHKQEEPHTRAVVLGQFLVLSL